MLDMTMRELLGARVRLSTATVPTTGTVCGLWVAWDGEGTDHSSAVYSDTRTTPLADPEDLLLAPDCGHHITHLLEQRYGQPVQQVASMELCGCKMPSLDKVRTITLASSGLGSTLGRWDSRLACPRLTDLDVSGNLFAGFRHVLALLRNLPALRFLAASSNDIHMTVEDVAACQTESFPQLKTLVLNKTRLPFRHVNPVLRLCPELQELSLCSNGYGCGHSAICLLYNSCVGCRYTAVELDASLGANIAILRLNDNLLVKWDCLGQLGRLASLHTLILSDNRLDDIEYPGQGLGPTTSVVGTDTPPFSKLRCINLSNTRLGTWACVTALGRFPALR